MSFCRFTLLSSVSAMVQGRFSVKVRVGVWPCLCEPQGTETLWGSRPCSDVPWPACRRLVKFSRLEEPRRTPTVGLCKNDCTDALIDQPGPKHRSLASAFNSLLLPKILERASQRECSRPAGTTIEPRRWRWGQKVALLIAGVQARPPEKRAGTKRRPLARRRAGRAGRLSLLEGRGPGSFRRSQASWVIVSLGEARSGLAGPQAAKASPCRRLPHLGAVRSSLVLCCSEVSPYFWQIPAFLAV